MKKLCSFFVSCLTLHALAFAQSPAIEWQQCFSGVVCDVVQTDDNGFIMTGYQLEAGTYALWVGKLDSLGTLQWEQNYGGTNDDRGFDIAIAPDSGFVVAGVSSSDDGDVSGNHGGRDIWVIRINESGGLVWQKCLGGSAMECLFVSDSSPSLTVSGNKIAVGSYTSSTDGDVSAGFGDQDVWVAVLNLDGDLLAERSFGGSQSDRLFQMVSSGDGGYVFIGSTASDDGDITGNIGGTNDAWCVHVDSGLNIVWQKLYGGFSGDKGKSIYRCPDGTFVIAMEGVQVEADTVGGYGYDAWVLKLDGSGEIIWQTAMGGFQMDQPTDVIQTMDGGYAVICATNSLELDVWEPNGSTDIFLCKLSATGVLLWTGNYGSSFGDRSCRLLCTEENALVFTGQTGTNNGDVVCIGTAGWLVKLDTIAPSIPLETEVIVPTLLGPPCSSCCPQNACALHVYVATRGGTPPYTFQWSTGETTKNRSHVCAGLSYLTVTDVQGEATVDTILAVYNAPIIVTMEIDTPACGEADGAVLLTIVEGVPPISYSWNNGSTEKDLTNIPAGHYRVYIKDSMCSKTFFVDVGNAGGPVATFYPTPPWCDDPLSGSVLCEVDACETAHSFLWSNGSTEQSLVGVMEGEYDVVITGANGCQNVYHTEVPYDAMYLSIQSTNPGCGDSTGHAEASFTNAPTPVSYVWSTGATTQNLDGVGTGTYSVTATAAYGCSAQGSVVLPHLFNYDLYATKESCNLGNGKIQLNIAYSGNYIWSTGATGTTIDSLTAGMYHVTLTVNDCSWTDSVYVYAEPSACYSTVTPPCACSAPYAVGFQNCSTSSGGFLPSPTAVYQWQFEGGMPSTWHSKQAPIVTYSSPGDYAVRLIITDPIHGCSDTLAIEDYVHVGDHQITVTGADSIVPIETPVTFGASPNSGHFHWSVNDGASIISDENLNQVNIIFYEPGEHEVTVSAWFDDSCGACSGVFKCFSVEVGDWLAVPTMVADDEFSVFPNPSTGDVRVQGTTGAGTLTIFDPLMHMVRQERLTDLATGALLQGLTGGFLHYRYIADNGKIFVGFISVVRP